MATVGYTLMTEQADPGDLVRWAARAEQTGFELLVSSDHYFPWLDSMGHAPNAWVTLGAVAQATERAELMTYVTCPTMRYHPTVVAQQAATLGVLSGGRFTLGLGTGEALNEHVVGAGWPSANERQEMLAEAATIIRALFEGGYVNLAGDYFQVDSAKLWDLPPQPVPIGIAVSGQQSCELFAPLADVMIAVEPDPRSGPGGTRRRVRRPRARSASCRSAGAQIATSACSGRTSCSGGSAAAGRSTPSCPARPASTRPPSSCGRGRRGDDPVRRLGRGGGRGGVGLLGGRFHRCGAGPDRRHRTRAGPVLPGRTGADRGAEGFCGLIVALRRS